MAGVVAVGARMVFAIVVAIVLASVIVILKVIVVVVVRVRARVRVGEVVNVIDTIIVIIFRITRSSSKRKPHVEYWANSLRAHNALASSRGSRVVQDGVLDDMERHVVPLRDPRRRRQLLPVRHPDHPRGAVDLDYLRHVPCDDPARVLEPCARRYRGQGPVHGTTNIFSGYSMLIYAF